MRVAVRDAESGRVGSASQFVEVPDFRRWRVALSGIIMNGPQAKELDGGWDASSKEYSIARPGTAALRVFHPGEAVSLRTRSSTRGWMPKASVPRWRHSSSF